jgi:UDP-N-acetylglucosamine 4,6-dehydratase
MVNWSQESILVTGGTGSFGKKFVEIMLRDYQPQRLVVFSRDELKQHEMRTSGFDHPSLRISLETCGTWSALSARSRA